MSFIQLAEHKYVNTEHIVFVHFGERYKDEEPYMLLNMTTSPWPEKVVDKEVIATLCKTLNIEIPYYLL